MITKYITKYRAILKKAVAPAVAARAKRRERDKGRCTSIATQGRSLALALLLFSTVALPAYGANYSLELVSPRAAGTSPSAEAGTPPMPSGHRIFKAYPGLAYNIRAVVIGGAYPYSFSLANAPQGMTINPSSGEIDWPNPQANAQPSISVTDAEGTTRSASWSISVTRDGFYFVDKLRGSPGNVGTLESPLQDLADFWNVNDSDGIVYFRSGTYTNAGIGRTSVGSEWERIEVQGGTPRIWLAYPGESPVIDNGYIAGANNGAFVRSGGQTYLDGLEIRNGKNILFQSGGGNYEVYRNLRMHQLRLGVDGGNPSAVMFLSHYSNADYYGSFQDNDFFDLNGGGGIKVYSKKKMLWEDNVFRNSTSGPDLKAHCPRFEVRRNHFYGNTGSYAGLFGNMDANISGEPCTGEIRFNRINQLNNYNAMDINQNGNAREIYVYRNTIVGTVRIRGVYQGTGPFSFYRNVIINSDANFADRIVQENIEVPSAVIINDNLDGSPSAGILDSNLNLTAAYASSIGRYGYQLGDEQVVVPSPPSNLRAE